ncbi:hypothetical protein [Benzoatithermus flavus]|uniref:Phosphatidate cytidylyltransferase n=1 Tax=Benzoatithermus flavus TaxID=3108223 RepID=A0ABU8XWT1_9PROT
MSRSEPDTVRAILLEELARPVPAEVAALAAAAAARHTPAARAVLFYGSCRRDGWQPGTLVDLYLLVESYEAAHAGLAARWANRLLPPNVYHLELTHAGGLLQAKYAVVTLAQLERLVGPATWNPYFWARLAQPVSLAWAESPAIAARVAAILERAVHTAFAEAVRLAGGDGRSEALWTGLLRASYATELRPERPERARAIVRQEAEHYRRLTRALRGTAPLPRSARAVRLAWTGRRLQGRLLAVLRLVKAAFTFAGGPDYIVWKIERHAGTPVRLAGWQRRHPLLAAPWLLLRLRRHGLVR